MTIKAVLFDKDGTLIDFSGTFGPATAKVIAALSGDNKTLGADLADALDFDLSVQACHPQSVLIAGSIDDIASALAPRLSRQDVNVLGKEIDALYIRHSTTSLTPFPFTEDTLRALTAMNLPLGVATNDSEEAALLHMRELKLESYFAFMCGFDSGYGGKPKPGMVQAFAKACSITPEDVAMVGDSETDMRAARAAGACPIAVTSGEASSEDLAPFADHILPDISYLPDFLETMIHKGNP